MKIESRDLDIRSLLSSGFYLIPRFQRPYSWDRENIQDFWGDIIQESPSEYFIGSMVIYEESKQVYGVVDGQQRLTTITLLLCAIRNLLDKNGIKDLAEGVHQLIERKTIDNKLQFVVKTESSYPFLQDRIQKWGPPSLDIDVLEEEKNLQAAFIQLTTLLEQIANSITLDTSLTANKKEKLLRGKMVAIRDAILNLNVITVRMDNEDDACLVFETLNTRGKDLSLADLVKNHVAKHIRSGNRQTDVVKIKWRKLLETIEGSTVPLKTDVFLHHFWLSRYDYLPAKSLFKAIKKRVHKGNVLEFLDDLLTNAELYRAIYDPAFGKWSKQEREVADALAALSKFQVVQPVPCILALVREYRHSPKKLKLQHLKDALTTIEKFHFFFTAITSQRSSGGISQMYASLARQMSDAADTQAANRVVVELKKKLRERVPSEDEFVALFNEVVVTDTFTKRRWLARYILKGLAPEGYSRSATDYDQLTIEHVVPQSSISDSMPEDVVGQLGNLIFVTSEVNIKLRDKPFAEKKKTLIASHVQMPDEIKTADAWGEAQIRSRTKAMALRAYREVWRIK